MQVAVREYGCLSCSGESTGLDFQVIPKVAFDALRERALVSADEKKPLLRPIIRRGRECLQVLNYVGLLQTPDGCRVEILPKTSVDSETPEHAREILWAILAELHGVKAVQAGDAVLETLSIDWLELLITHALEEIAQLVRRGISRDYIRHQNKSKFLKGQLEVSKQIRLRPGQQDRFCISFDHYSPDRPENRLIKSALAKLEEWTRSLNNQRVCRELQFVLSEVSFSTAIRQDLERWSDSRELAHYRSVKPWVELILTDRSPVFSAGKWQGVSLLFPMEKLFEDYVASVLSKQLIRPYKLKEQAKSQSLVSHNGKPWFRLQPDLLVNRGRQHIAVLDTKWKLLDQNKSDARNKYEISQSDMYQLYAYGKKYLAGEGSIYLIYPKHEKFNGPLALFSFDERLTLHAIPFDIKKRQLVSGDWEHSAGWLRDKLEDVA